MIKYILHITLLLTAMSCKSQNKVYTTQKMDTIISKQQLFGIMDTLSSDYFEGRETGTEGIYKAACFIENFLKEYKIKPFFKDYRDTFQIYSRPAFNVVALIPGNDPVLKNEYIIISAHYDHEGKIQGSTDSVFNGANDNASGVATVLNTARIISSNKLNKRSVIVALFTGEELGLTGSFHFATKINGLYKINFAANIDMIGSVLTDEPGKVYITGYQKSNMAEIFNKYIGNQGIVNWQEEEQKGIFRMSDNYPLYKILKIPSHTFCTFDFKNYPYYHEVSDEMDKVDIDNTLIIANHISTAIRKLSESKKNEINLK